MARRARYGRRKTNRNYWWILAVFFVGVAAWLLLSIIQGKNPIELFQSETQVESSEIPYDSLQSLLEIEKQNTIKLESELTLFKSNAQVKSVEIDNGTLNLRSEPNTTASIIDDIPSGKQINVYYCLPDSFNIAGNRGTWCKVRHNSVEGWVWSSYIKK